MRQGQVGERWLNADGELAESWRDAATVGFVSH